MDEETDSQMDNLDLEAQEDVDQQDDGSIDPSDIEEKSKEELIEMLRQNQEEAKQQKSSYDNLRSVHDRQMTEVREQIAEMRGALSVKKEDNVDDSEAQGKFDAEWAEKINENPGEATMQFARGLMSDVLTQVRKELNDSLSGVKSQVETLDPEFLANRKQVESLMKEDGLTRQQALSVAKKMAPKVSQPGRAAIPGKVQTGTKTTAPSESMSFDDTNLDVMRFLGVDPKEIATELLKERSA